MSTEETKTAATEELWRIAETDRIDQVDTLVENGANINASNEHGMTALMRATASGRVRMVSVLLAHGADPNASRNDKFTPLLLASFFGHEEIVKILVEHGADTDATSRFKTSAQMWATCRNFFEVVDYLEQPRTPNRNEELLVCDNGPVATSDEENIPVQPDLPVVEDIDAIQPTHFEPIPQPASRARLKWSLVGFGAALVLVLMVMLTDRAILREDQLPPVTTQGPSTEVRVDPTHLTDSSTDQNLVPPAVPTPEKLVIVPKENPLETKQQELEPKPVTRAAVSTAEPRVTENLEQETKGATVSLPEPSSEQARTTEPAPTPQPLPSRERTTVKPLAPASNQLLTGSKSSAPPGKVIRWP
jgi:hypothetical protein